MSGTESDISTSEWCFVNQHGDTIHIHENGSASQGSSIGEISTVDAPNVPTDMNDAILDHCDIASISEEDNREGDLPEDGDPIESESASNIATIMTSSNSALNQDTEPHSHVDDKHEDTADLIIKTEEPENVKGVSGHAEGNFQVNQKKISDSSSDISVIDEEFPLIRSQSSNASGNIDAASYSNIMRPSEMLQCMTASQTHQSTPVTPSRIPHSSDERFRMKKRHHSHHRSRRYQKTEDKLDREKKIILVLLLFAPILMYVIYDFHAGRCQCYANMYNDILACIGKKHFEAAKDESYQDVPNMCLNETVFRSKIENQIRYFSLERIMFQVQEMIHADENVDLSEFLLTDVSGIDMKLLVQHLEHYDILPKMLTTVQISDFNKKRKCESILASETKAIVELKQAMANLTERNEKWQNQVLFVINQKNNVTIQKLKSRIRRSISEADQDRITRNVIESKLQELLEQNVGLKAEINNLKEFTKKNITHVEHLVRDADSSKNYTQQLDGILQNMKEIKNQTGILQEALKEKTSGTEELTQRIDAITAKLDTMEQAFTNMSSSPPAGSKSQTFTQSEPPPESYSWEWFKIKYDNVVEEAQKVYNEAVEKYESGEMAEVISNYAKEGQQQAEVVTETILQNFETVQKKTEEIIKEHIDVNATLDRAKQVWDTFQNKLADVTNQIADELSKQFPNEKKPDTKEKKDKHTIRKTVKRAWSFIKKKWLHLADKFENFAAKAYHKVKAKCDNTKASPSDTKEDNWYLKRAAERQLSRRSGCSCMNWYLLRERNRERLRQKKRTTPPYSTCDNSKP